MGDAREEIVEPHQGPDPDKLAAFLATAPDELKGWADEQLAQLQHAGASSAEALAEDEDAVGVEAFHDEDFDDEPAPAPAPRPAKAPGKPARTKGFSALGVNKINLVLVALLAAAIVIIVQQMGSGAPHPETTAGQMPPTSSGMPSGMTTYEPLDEAKAAELKATAEAEPENIDVRLQLAEMYLDSGLYQDAIDFLEQILALDPDNLEGLLAIGVAELQLGDSQAAEQHWVHATEVAPNQPEPWYNLGFLYVSIDPPNFEAAEQAWTKVIELAPDSELAQSAAAHLERFRDQASSPPTGR